MELALFFVINLLSYQFCCISYCVLIVFVFVINLDWMTSAQRDNAVSSRDCHSLMSLISFYLLEALPLLSSCTNFECLDLISDFLLSLKSCWYRIIYIYIYMEALTNSGQVILSYGQIECMYIKFITRIGNTISCIQEFYQILFVAL